MPVIPRHLSSSAQLRASHRSLVAPRQTSRRSCRPRWDDVQRMTRRGIQWLSAVADDPVMCRAHWADDPRRPYALPTGRLFDVVVMSQRLGMETFDQLVRREMPLGPVMMDRRAKQIGFLLSSKSRGRFTRLLSLETATPPEYRYLDAGSFVVVPGPMPMADDRHQWLRAPIRRPEASPLRTASLAVMFAAASALIERADRYGVQYPSPEAAGPEDSERVSDRAQ
ncbi:bifunctional DNA primase/polymerase [Streptomyces lydicus]|uniref:bifunctional DNA primase/polymerase n=1 Tax=Streptomyces lydicus TaxID=47763 RepID=UPI0037D44F1F